MFCQSALNGLKKVSRWGACPLHQAMRHVYTWSHITSNTHPTVHSGVEQAKVSASSLFAEVPVVVLQNGEQGKMLYPRQERRKNQDPPNYYQATPEVSRPN